MIPPVELAAGSLQPAAGGVSKASEGGFAELLEAHSGKSKGHKKRDAVSPKTPPSKPQKNEAPSAALLLPHTISPLPHLAAALKKHAGQRIEQAAGSRQQAASQRKPEAVEEKQPAAAVKPMTPHPAAPATAGKPEPIASSKTAEIKAPAEVTKPPPVELPNDPALSLAIMPRAAHFQLKTDDLGDVRLHLRVRDGVADVRIDAAQASLFGPREAELRTVLASQGLELGAFDLQKRQAGGGGEPDRDRQPPSSSAAPAATARASQSATRPAARHAGRIDVEA